MSHDHKFVPRTNTLAEKRIPCTSEFGFADLGCWEYCWELGEQYASCEVESVRHCGAEMFWRTDMDHHVI